MAAQNPLDAMSWKQRFEAAFQALLEMEMQLDAARQRRLPEWLAGAANSGGKFADADRVRELENTIEKLAAKVWRRVGKLEDKTRVRGGTN